MGTHHCLVALAPAYFTQYVKEKLSVSYKWKMVQITLNHRVGELKDSRNSVQHKDDFWYQTWMLILILPFTRCKFLIPNFVSLWKGDNTSNLQWCGDWRITNMKYLTQGRWSIQGFFLLCYYYFMILSKSSFPREEDLMLIMRCQGFFWALFISIVPLSSRT